MQVDELPPSDTPWKRFRDEKPRYDGWGERHLLTWCARTGSYDLGCIDGSWGVGEEIDGHEDDLWRWLDVNPERHLKPACRACGSTRTREELDAIGAINCCPERSMNEVIEQRHGIPALTQAGVAELRAVLGEALDKHTTNGAPGEGTER